MLELPNFGQMTTSTVEFESRDKTLLVTTSCTEIMMFQNILYFKISLF